MTGLDTIAISPIGALSIGGFCRLYNQGRTRTYEEINSGRLRAVKAGKRTLIRRCDAEAWAAALPPLGAVR